MNPHPILLAIAVAAALLPTIAPAQYSGSLEERVARLERLTESRALVGMLQRLDALQRDIQALQGANEVQDHRLKRLKQRQRELYVDVDRRLQGLEGATTANSAASVAAAPAAAAAATAGTASVAPTAGTAGPVDPARERSEYRSAFELLRDGRHQAAISAFQQVLASYPNGRYAANAQYWIGEAYYVERQFEPALAAFGQVVSDYPSSSKVPDAMLKIGYIHAEQNRVEKARKVLRQLSKQYPQSSAAGLAQQRLQGL